MENNYPNWSLYEYLRWVMEMMGLGLEQPGDFWTKLGGVFFALMLGACLVPISIIIFIVKNGGRVGGLTWALVIVTPIVIFLWIALA